ncbi:ABC transporter ATP-binding protein/permease [Rhodoblastus sp.]|uniref:ABC transporter ATP-binding protein/permease n=1 Tax=Rhodoblastus sp. TaxID=1962975 RepID=UPI003F9497F9
MVEQPEAARQDATDAKASRENLVALLKSLLGGFRHSPALAKLLWLGFALVVVVGATTAAQVRLNEWTKAFYDSLADKDLAAFISQLQVFAAIAGVLLVLNVAQMRLNLTAKMKLREGLTRDLVGEWFTSKRAFLIAGAGRIGVNPDQRIDEDARRLTELSTDLGVGLLQAMLLLVCFVGVLWVLSAGVVFTVQGHSFSIPGYMVWCALLLAGGASLASWRAARRLVPLNAERYARESNLRFALVHANEHNEGISVYRGEEGERNRLNRELQRLLLILRGIVLVTTGLTWITAGYGWFMLVAPVIVAAPAYFAGNLSFGGMLMAVGAFDQVQQSLRWFVDNVGNIADWRATLFRVGAFRLALQEMDQLGRNASRIERVASADGNLHFDDLGVISPSGCAVLDEKRVKIEPGEHVLILGAPGVGKTSLFRALAGLWPWGRGRVGLPEADGILFMPKRPYLPEGSLREVLAYPESPKKFQTGAFVAALSRFGLAHLAPALDHVARWDRDLTGPEQQALAFARLLLHQPRWVFVDEAIDALTPQARQAVFDIFRHELAAAALVCISGSQAEETFFTRILRLSREPQGECLVVPSARISELADGSPSRPAP